MQIRSSGKSASYGSELYNFQPAILRTNKKINNEAHRFLYNDNLFVLVRYPRRHPWHALVRGHLTPLPVKEDEVHCSLSSSRLSMLVDLQAHDLGDEELDGLTVESGFVIVANELEILCRILVRLDQEHPGFLMRLNLKLGIFPPYQLVANAPAITGSSSPLAWKSRPFPEQRILLEPFSTLYSVKNFAIASIDGRTDLIDAQLMQGVKGRASRPPPSLEEVTVTTRKIEEHGNEAFGAGDFLHACVLYKKARAHLKRWINYHGRELFSEFNEGDRARLQLGLRIRSSLVAALIRLQRWSEAHMSVTDEIWDIAGTEDFGRVKCCDPSDLAKLYYLRALASEGMGKLTEAGEDIRQALRFDPQNTEIRATLEGWMKSAKWVGAALKSLTM